MAKAAIPYERVSEAGFGLVARGEKITNRSVRAISGGSPTTVSQHLARLEKEHPELFTPQRPAALELPAGLLRAIQEEMRRSQAEAGAALEERLGTARADMDDLTRENEELQQETSALQAERDELAADRDRLKGQVEQQASDQQRLQQQLEESQRAAEAARVALAQANLKAESQQEIANSLRNERDSLRKLNDEERAGRIEALRELAGANASLEQVRKHLDQMIQLHEEVEADRAEVQKSLDAARAAQSNAEKQLAACQAEAKAAKERAEDLQRREGILQGDLKQRDEALQHALANQRPRKEKSNDED